ncbi:MAG: NPCBM/NEW2 domain-containing protein, partial [Verrucomicrobiales bacterium]|nr:NPCBM/NEW2 domain-containing protein [Verrucomicrobiales bacterium]
EWADINADGKLDMVTGRRFFAHGFRPEKVDEDSQIYWFDVKLTKGKPAEFIPHKIDDQSGVGAQFVTTDFNNDGKLDIAVSNRKGVFLFLQKNAGKPFPQYASAKPNWKEEADKFRAATKPQIKAKPTTAKGAGKPVYESKIVDTKNRTTDIKANIKGARNLFLVVDDAGNYSHDWADWINPRLVGPKGETKLTSLKWKRTTQQWGQTRIGKNAGGGPLALKGRTFTDGIGTHANAIIEYELPADAGYTEFRATGIIDDGGVQGTDQSAVQFLVYTQLPAPRQKKIARASAGAGGFDPEAYKSVDKLTLDMFSSHDDLEVTVWGESPLFYNPTNIDIDKDGRIWVAEGVRYRGAAGLRPEGDRIMVIEDTDGDGKADKSHVFVQEEFLLAPLGVAVIDNKIIVSQTPTLLVYTDVNRNLVFDDGDTREELLTGFQGRNHDHSLHSVTAGPDGQWYFNHGNCGSTFTDKSGKTFRIGSPYMNKNVAGQKSDDGNVWLGGATVRMNPDGTDANIIGHNYRNSYEQAVTSVGDVFQNDNDDPPASRTTFVMEYGNAGFASSDGTRSWQADRRPGQDTPRAEWRQDDPGTMPSGDVYGGGSPTGIAHYEHGALGDKYNGLLLSCEPARNVVFGYHPEHDKAGFKLDRFDFVTTNLEKDFAGADFRGGASWDKKKTLFRPSDVAVGVDGAIYVADWYDPRVGGHSMIDRTCYGTIYRIAPKGFKPAIPKFDLGTTSGQIAALLSPAVNVRNLGFVRLQAAGAKSVPAVATLLADDNRFIRGRAIWLLSQLGKAGIARI